MAAKKTPVKRKRSTAKKTIRRKRKTGLSAGFNKANLMTAIKELLASGAGGAAAPYANRAFTTIKNKWVRILVVGGAGAIGANMVGMRAIGNGFFGGIVALNTQDGFLNDPTPSRFADENSLNETPIFLSEDNVPMKMLEDGTLQELNEYELAELDALMELEEQ
jgi:hypothetical protein